MGIRGYGEIGIWELRIVVLCTICAHECRMWVCVCAGMGVWEYAVGNQIRSVQFAGRDNLLIL
ncbi:hypothetical protein B484DRAFT_459294 [Ochromonadaceae sp. CCMP2298]|nr:hypothetical protein B484DRAFT_459294 [Ochromonadaceae sp. CCMP2298]